MALGYSIALSVLGGCVFGFVSCSKCGSRNGRGKACVLGRVSFVPQS